MKGVDHAQRDEELDRLRSELAEWRRRAEVAEAVSAERLTRAETAEMALQATNAALRTAGGTGATGKAVSGTRPPPDRTAPSAPDAPAGRPRTLRERWRRYVDSIN